VYKCAAILFVALSASAQSTSLNNARGEITRQGEFPLIGYSIEFTNPSDSSGEMRTQVNSSGSFEFRGIPAGNYRARILKNDTPVYTTWVIVRNDASVIQIEIPDSVKSDRPASGTISMKRLAHKIPKKAMKEMNKSVDARAKGDLEKSLQHLRKAVEIDPEFTEGYVNLGARYMELKRLDEAQAAFERAAQIDPHCPEAHSNLALVYITKRMPKEAAAEARRSIEINDGSAKAHFVLAFSLAAQDPRSVEALRHYERAAAEFPKAHLGAAQVLMAQGDRASAEKALKEYLRTGDQSNRALAQTFLAKLQQ
jgi:tetratricopeptide (TPR) repeat protein